MSLNKKSQIWYADFTIALLIFMLAVVVYFQLTNNISEEESSLINDMVLDLKRISSDLMSLGYPENWTVDNFTQIGLTNGNYRINETKISEFYSIDYDTMKIYFDTKYDIYFYLEDTNRNVVQIDSKNGVGKVPVDTESNIESVRFGIYNGTLVRMVLQLWS